MRVRTLKLHDGSIFVPNMITLQGVLQAGITQTQKGECTIEMTMQTNGAVVVDLKVGGAKAKVHVPSAAYAYAIEAPQDTKEPAKK